jgi:hypothetical protein
LRVNLAGLLTPSQFIAIVNYPNNEPFKMIAEKYTNPARRALESARDPLCRQGIPPIQLIGRGDPISGGARRGVPIADFDNNDRGSLNPAEGAVSLTRPRLSMMEYAAAAHPGQLSGGRWFAALV